MASDEQTAPEASQLPILPSLVRDATLAELSRLDSFVQSIGLEDWKRPSAAESWTIGDVVAHLDIMLRVYNQLLGAVLAGRGAGTAWKAFGQLTKRAGPLGSRFFNTVNSTIPRFVGEATDPEVLKGRFAARARHLRETLDRAGQEDWARPAHYMGRPWPLSFFLTSVINELAIHGWDMASTLRGDAHLSDEARSILPWFYWGATSYMFHRPETLTGTVQATLADPVAEMWWEIGPESSTQGSGVAAEPSVTISGESGTFVLVLAGRIPADDALRTTSLSADNDSLARPFLSAWKIV